ncbi:MAG: hypothetical protein MUC91_05125 [Verrucomicrobia bacterium]|nr:hypothetical protein [Verrucomicrobiota bacterium]
MSDQWAADNLQTIRTLMERAAVYRRALAPVMTVTGVIGMVAAFAGWKTEIVVPGPFILYWLCVALVALGAGVVLIRRQAIQQGEAFWSPPTRRVAQAMLPPLFAGLALGAVALILVRGSDAAAVPGYWSHVGLPLLWVMLYGCAVHAAGFFMKRGIRVFGWLMVILACLGFALGKPETAPGLADLGYGIMGGVFGLLHTLYGIYLFATEPRDRPE